MLENTTGDNGFQGNPESGIDRFLNENKDSTTEVDVIETMKAKILDLETRLASSRNLSTSNHGLWMSAVTKMASARDLIQEVLDDSIEASELMETFEDAFKLLGVTMTETTEYTVTATWTVSITHPKDDTPSGYDFTAELELDNSDYEIDGRIPTPEMDVNVSY